MDLRKEDIDKLEEEYREWAKSKSTEGYVHGWHASYVFKFLKEKKIHQLNSGFVTICGKEIFVGTD